MKKLSVAQWAKTIDISEEVLDGYLEELGYQIKSLCNADESNVTWQLTLKGKEHASPSINFIKPEILWDIDAFSEAMKLHGKKTGKYFYCDKCGVYLNAQVDFDITLDKWICRKCGYQNQLHNSLNIVS